MAIAAPSADDDYPDRQTECEAALKPGFEAIAENATGAGNPTEAVARELVETAGRLRAMMTGFGETQALLEIESDMIRLVERATEAGWNMDETVETVERLSRNHADAVSGHGG